VDVSHQQGLQKKKEKKEEMKMERGGTAENETYVT